MPHISLSLYSGRSDEALQNLSESLQKCLMDAAGWKAEDISVSVESIEAKDFVSIVNKKITREKITIESDLIK